MFKTVKSKVSLVYLSLVLLIILLGAVTIVYMVRVSRTIDGLIVTNYNSIDRLTNMEYALHAQNVAVLKYLYNDDQNALISYEQQKVIFNDKRQKEASTIIIPREREYIENISAYYEEYCQRFNNLQELRHSGGSRSEEIQYYNDYIVPQQLKVEDGIGLLFSSNEEALFARKDAAAQMAVSYSEILFCLFLFAAIVGYWLATIYTNRFFAPIAELTQTIKSVREGNMNRKTTIKTKDEFGVLADEFNNMTQRLQEYEQNTMESLLNEKSKSNSIVKSINEPLVIINTAGEIVLLNKAFSDLFNLNKKDVIGKTLLELIPHSDFADYIDNMNTYAQAPKDVLFMFNKNKEELFFQVGSTPIMDKDNHLSGMIMVFHNITELKLLERARGDFIATISHEFKTPLTSIVMGTDLMFNEMVGKINQEQKEILEAVREDTERLQSMVEEILALSKIESSKMIYNMTSCNINTVIITSVKQFLPIAERKGVHLKVYCPPGLPPVWADNAKIIWVLNNLLSNALKYTKSGDDIDVQAYTQKDMLYVSVTDTGVGIPEDFTEKIFDKFVQLKGYDLEIRGSGVGLAVSKEIITAHGGEIWCKSKLGEGSKFTFTLKIAEDKDFPAADNTEGQIQ